MLKGVGAVVDVAAVPIIEGAAELAGQGVVPGGTRRNLRDADEFCDLSDVDETAALLLTDAQTNGGLLIAAAPERATEIIGSLPGAAAIGEFVSEHPNRIALR